MNNEEQLDSIDKIAYSESRTINIGNYEKVEAFFSYSKKIVKYNLVDKTIEIQHSESMTIDDENNNFRENANAVVSKVKKVLDFREKQIRDALAKKQDFTDEY
jgi:hypothetical protein